MSPAPHPDHQRIVARFWNKLNLFVAPAGLGECFLSPLDVVLTPRRVVQPDVFFITQARMVPNFVQDGQGKRVDGFRVFKIIPGSIFEKLGIRDGDVIKKINNAPLDSVDQAFMLLQSLRYEKKFDIDVLRGNQPVTMTYQVVE